MCKHERARAGEARRRARVGPVCRFRGKGGAGTPDEGVWAALGRVWAAVIRGEDGRPSATSRHGNSAKGRLRGPWFGTLWGRSILEQDKGPRR